MAVSDQSVLFLEHSHQRKKNYFVTDKEALAIYWSVRKLFQYLQNQQFIIRTDHKPLIGILGENENVPTMASARF